MAIYRLGDLVPHIAPGAWVAESATVIGNVTLGEQANIWYGAVVRGDNDAIRIGARSNVQENSVLHVDPGISLEVEEDVTVGHQAMLHGCHIGAGTLIGIQAVILNHARIGRGCLVGAGAVVPERREFPDGALIVGAPAKVVRMLAPEEIENLRRMALGYLAKAALHRDRLVRIDSPSGVSGPSSPAAR